jgi:ABC-2 type transport system ATP-binding protein
MSISLELSVKDLVIAYGDYIALEISDLTINGAVISIIGHNGSGKSTLIKSMLQVITPRSGILQNILIENNTRRELEPHSDMAFSPENGAVFADMSVKEYLELWSRMKHNNPQYFEQEGKAILERLRIPELYDKLGRELSKGLRRRVQMAVGFLLDPRLFLFDEPFDGLDVKQVVELTNLLNEKKQEMVFFISSHRMDVVEQISDAIIVLKNGKLRSYGDAQKVKQDLLGEHFKTNSTLLDAMNYDLQDS